MKNPRVQYDLDCIGRNKDRDEFALNLYMEKLINLRYKKLETRHDKIDCVMQAITDLEAFFLHHKLLKGMDTEHPDSWMSDLLADILQPSIKTLNEYERIGVIVTCLIHYGSSRIQAIQACAQWLGLSETKVRDAHIHYKKHYDIPLDDLCFLFSETLKPFVNKIKRPFPEDYPKAAKAFEIFKAELYPPEPEYLKDID